MLSCDTTQTDFSPKREKSVSFFALFIMYSLSRLIYNDNINKELITMVDLRKDGEDHVIIPVYYNVFCNLLENDWFCAKSQLGHLQSCDVPGIPSSYPCIFSGGRLDLHSVSNIVGGRFI